VTTALVPFAGAHAAAVVELIASVFVEYGMTFDPGDFDADLLDVPAHYTACGGAFTVLLDAGRVAGTVAVLPREGGACEVKRLYLRREVRGRGHGRRLMEHVLGWATAQGFERMIAWSDTRLVTAHALYRRLGFRSMGERITDDPDQSHEYGFVLALSRRRRGAGTPGDRSDRRGGRDGTGARPRPAPAAPGATGQTPIEEADGPARSSRRPTEAAPPTAPRRRSRRPSR
jgi:GNAT superfamily N-acetyltransferase